LPERAVDDSMSRNFISPILPEAKKESVAVLKASYPTRDDAQTQLPAAFENFYKQKYADVYAQHPADVQRSAQGVLEIYNRNVFPAMKITWGTYPNNLGHMDFPGCFRCHDDSHSASNSQKITQDCNACHNVLAVDEASPKVLTDLGYPSGVAPSADPQHSAAGAK